MRINKIIKTLIFSSFIFFIQLNGMEELLQRAIKSDDSSVLEVVLKYSGDINSPALNKAIRANDLNSAIILINYGVDVNKRDAKSNIRINGNKGWFADVPVDGPSALELAVENNINSLIPLLLESGANPYSLRYTINTTNNFVRNITAVSLSIEKNNLFLIKAMLENGLSLNEVCFSTHQYSAPDKNKYTPLQFSLSFHREKTDLLNFLISNKAQLENN